MADHTLRTIARRALAATAAGATLLLAGSPASGQAAALRRVRLPLPPHLDERGRAHARAVHGEATLTLPARWTRGSAAGHHAAHLRAPLSSTCVAEVEVQIGITRITGPIGAEVDHYIDFWFDTGVPAPVNVVASGRGADERWVLAVPGSHEPPPETTSDSPFFGVFVKRVAPGVWASIGLGPRVPRSCGESPALLQTLQHGLTTMLRSARLTARIG